MQNIINSFVLELRYGSEEAAEESSAEEAGADDA